MAASGAALGALLIGTVILAASWVGSGSAVDISGNYGVISRFVAHRDADLIDRGDLLTVLWASRARQPGIVVAEKGLRDATWSRDLIKQMKPSWAPSAVPVDGGYVAAWVSGTSPDDADGERDLILYDDQGAGTIQLMQGIYGEVAPDLAADPTGVHLAFTSAVSESNYLEGALYYAFRAAGTTAWPVPTLVVTNGAVIPDAWLAGIYQPRIAVTDEGVIHLVWQQWAVDSPTSGNETLTIWHVSRPLDGDSLVWSAPQRLSPAGQSFAVMPAILAAEDGTVHVTWTAGLPTQWGQNIYHRALAGDQVTKINHEIIQVNKNSPNWIASDITADGEEVCVAWHGFMGTQGGGDEQVHFQCSDDGGMTWDGQVQVSEAAGRAALFPSIIFDGARKLHVAWVEYGSAESALSRQTLDVAAPQGVFYRTGSMNHQIYLPLVLK